jgi:preprotein translocase YajC subunit
MVRRKSLQPGTSMLISSAYAQTATAAAPSSMAGLIQFAPILLIMVVFYFLLIRPQQAQAKELKLKQASLTRGDKVIVSVMRSTITQVIAQAKADKV